MFFCCNCWLQGFVSLVVIVIIKNNCFASASRKIKYLYEHIWCVCVLDRSWIDVWNFRWDNGINLYFFLSFVSYILQMKRYYQRSSWLWSHFSFFFSSFSQSRSPFFFFFYFSYAQGNELCKVCFLIVNKP